MSNCDESRSTIDRESALIFPREFNVARPKTCPDCVRIVLINTFSLTSGVRTADVLDVCMAYCAYYGAFARVELHDPAE
jgi:hypothetical protein